MKKRKNYSAEFKLEAVELASRIGIAKAAKELGIHETSIRTWKKKIEGPTMPQGPIQTKKNYSDLEKENKKLQKEIGYLKEINRVLKKSTAIFSADLMGSSK